MSTITKLVPIPSGINQGIKPARQQTMLSLIGNPRATYTSKCQNPTNPLISSLIVVETVGRLKVRGLSPAVASLRAVIDEIRTSIPDVLRRSDTWNAMRKTHYAARPRRSAITRGELPSI
ncbi:MAG: hypothetical protein IPJ73_21680 [Zoogloea sp.]|nr:hypothetical protein [Zoogloea sp.]